MTKRERDLIRKFNTTFTTAIEQRVERAKYNNVLAFAAAQPLTYHALQLLAYYETKQLIIPRIHLDNYGAHMSNAALKRLAITSGQDPEEAYKWEMQDSLRKVEISIAADEVEAFAKWLPFLVVARESDPAVQPPPAPVPMYRKITDWLNTDYQWSRSAYEQYQAATNTPKHLFQRMR